MSAVLLPFHNPLALAKRAPEWLVVEYVTVDGDDDKLLVTDRELGTVLGYADPLAAMDALYEAHAKAFTGHTGLIRLHQAEPSGREVVRVFDLEAAMLMCRIALTPQSAMVFGSLKGTESSRAVSIFERACMLSAEIVPFPRKEVRHG